MSELFLDRALRKIEYTFRWTGMNFESNAKTYSENLKYKCVLVISFILLNIDVTATLSWFIAGVLRSATFTTLIYIAPCITYCLLANMKCISMLLNSETSNEILSTLRNLETEHRKQKNNAQKEEIIKKEVDLLFRILKVMNFFNWSLLLAFPLMPLCLMALEYYETRSFELKLPYYVLYYEDPYDMKYWPWIYLKETSAIITLIFVVSGVDYLFYVCAAFICIQFKLLQHDLRNFVPSDTTYSYKLYPDAKLRTNLVKLIKWHQVLIRTTQLLEKMYKKANLMNFLLSSFLICLCGFNVMLMTDDKPFMLSFGSFLFVCLLQIFSICYYGDLLMRSSTAVGDAIFESKWYLTNASVRKEVNIIQLRSRKPCKITAYHFADVNLNAFTKILSTSWSYFALLRSVYNRTKMFLSTNASLSRVTTNFNLI